MYVQITKRILVSELILLIKVDLDYVAKDKAPTKETSKEKIKLLLFYNVFIANKSNEKNKTNNSGLKNV